ncbi:hypothetical protein [Nocardia sp. alder85J]|uniref:hypothetical protein n=1 Tax=Nocardia sp. alder85J TaxID=2862949 RepID=UPI001CD37213|nr:hypothetical protein [Nocardia sp. alder85J]MCX4092343.1 hypothetical protein [Nocardia sp. alder85J]
MTVRTTGGDRPASAAAQRIAELSADHGLSRTADFVAAIPDADDRGILLLNAVDIDAEPLARWLTSRGTAAPVRRATLLSAGADPAGIHNANRVVVALSCGELLSQSIVDAVSDVLARPAGTFVVVLCGAETLTGPDEFDIVRRAVWQVLLGGPGIDWRGQDLAAHGCLLWSSDVPYAALRETITADMDRLTRWSVDGPPAGDPLGAARLSYAITLAETEAAEHVLARDRGAMSPVDTARVQARRAGDRLRDRLTGDLAVLARQLDATLDTFERDLLAEVIDRVGAGDAPVSGPALRQWTSEYLADAVRTWQRQATDLVAARMQRTEQETRALLDGVDWPAINAALGRERTERYPAVLLTHLRRFSTPTVGTPIDPLAPQPDSSPWPPVLRSAGYGGVAAILGSLVLAPIVGVPLFGGALVVTAASATGGVLAGLRVSHVRDRRGAVEYVRQGVTAVIDRLRTDLRAHRNTTDPILPARIVDEFVALDSALTAAVSEATHSGPDPALMAELSALRAASTMS